MKGSKVVKSYALATSTTQERPLPPGDNPIAVNYYYYYYHHHHYFCYRQSWAQGKSMAGRIKSMKSYFHCISVNSEQPCRCHKTVWLLHTATAMMDAIRAATALQFVRVPHPTNGAHCNYYSQGQISAVQWSSSRCPACSGHSLLICLLKPVIVIRINPQSLTLVQ
jgi:hypothetical protein